MSRSRTTIFNQRERHHVRRATPDYPSAPDTGCSTYAKDQPRYSGDNVVGIATMHKSNPVPVTAGINTNPKLQQGGSDA